MKLIWHDGNVILRGICGMECERQVRRNAIIWCGKDDSIFGAIITTRHSSTWNVLLEKIYFRCCKSNWTGFYHSVQKKRKKKKRHSQTYLHVQQTWSRTKLRVGKRKRTKKKGSSYRPSRRTSISAVHSLHRVPHVTRWAHSARYILQVLQAVLLKDEGKS